MDQEDILKALGMNPRDPKVQAMVMVALKYDLDPLLGHIMIVQQQVYVSHAGLLHVAHRSGDLDGIETDCKEMDNKWVAKSTIYRKSMSKPFSYIDECGKTEKVRDPRKRAVTRAERNALRRAFDVDVDVWDYEDRSPGPALSGPRPALPAAKEEAENEAQADATDPPALEAGGVPATPDKGTGDVA